MESRYKLVSATSFIVGILKSVRMSETWIRRSIFDRKIRLIGFLFSGPYNRYRFVYIE